MKPTSSSILIIATLAALVATRSADALGFEFRQDGFDEGAFAIGSFAGVDVNNDGQLSTFGPNNELSTFNMSFSGNSSVAPFSLSFSNLISLVYDLGTPFLGDGIVDAGDPPGKQSEGIFASGQFPDSPALFFDYITGQGPLGIDSGEVSGPTGFSISSTERLVVVTVPEGGSTLPLLALACAATCVAGRIHQSSRK